MSEAFTIRAPRVEEAGLLSDLALRSKAHWGYGPEFMARCVVPLTIKPETIRDGWVRVAQCRLSDDLFGVCSLATNGKIASLDKLFVDPGAMGLGVGRALFDAAVAAAAEADCESMVIESDPDAEPFYLRMGAVRIGETPSEAIPGRMLPLLVYRLTENVVDQAAGSV